MGLEGKLEDLPLSDILHIVNLSKRTGLLILGTDRGKSSIVFKNGKITNVLTDEPVLSLGDILVSRELITKDELEKALEDMDGGPMGRHLVEKGVLPEKEVEDSVKIKIIAAVRKLLEIKSGTFNFKLNEEIPVDGIGMSPRELPVHSGIDPQLIIDSGEAGKQGVSNGRIYLESLAETTSFAGLLPDGTRKEHEKPGEETVHSRKAEEKHEKKEERADREKEAGEDIKAGGEIAGKPSTGVVSEEALIDELTGDGKEPVPPAAAAEKTKKVVIAEDEALFRSELESFLTKKGFKVYAVDSTLDAINSAGDLYGESGDFVIITDLLMRTVDGKSLLGGLDILQRARDIDETIPVILMTDHLDPRARHKAYELGVTNYLIKPDVSRIELSHVEEDLEQFCEEVLFILRRLFKEMSRYTHTDRETSPPLIPEGEGSSYRQIKAIKKLVTELQNPAETSEISLMVLRLASEFLERGILFLVKRDIVFGLGGFGDTGDDESINTKVKRIQIPREEDSVFRKVIETMETHQGKLKDTMWNRLIIEGLGKIVPREVVVIPLISRRKVIALLYGDNAGTNRPLGNIEGLEIFMSQAGIAMENTLLQRQLDRKGN